MPIHVNAGCVMEMKSILHFSYLVKRWYATAHDMLLELLFGLTEAPAWWAALQLFVRHTPSVCIIVENTYLNPTIAVTEDWSPLLALCSEVDPLVTRHHIV